MPNYRGVVLRLDDATAIHRWLELLMDDRKFWNPIDAREAEEAVKGAKERLAAKLHDVFVGPGPYSRRRRSPRTET